MIKNIIKQLWNEKRTNIWIAVEIMIVSVLLWFIIGGMFRQYAKFHRPMGFDIENVYDLTVDVLPSSATEYISKQEKGTTMEEDLLYLLSRIRKVEGVEAVSAHSCAAPYAGCNSNTMYETVHGADTLGFVGMFRVVSPEYFKVFRISSTEGHLLGQEKLPMYVLSRNLADSLKLSRGGIVWTNSTGNEQQRMDVCTDVCYAETWSDVENGYYVISETDYLQMDFPSEICVRLHSNLREEQKTAVWERIKDACHFNNLSLFYYTPFDQIREKYLSREVDDIKMNICYAAFLLLNIFLGVVGTFWFRTNYRRGEIGLRLAVGSTRRSIFGFLIMEGLLLLALVMPVVIVVMITLSHHIIENVSVINFTFVTLVTWVLMSLMIFLGIWYPAWQAMKIEPADALHEE